MASLSKKLEAEALQPQYLYCNIDSTPLSLDVDLVKPQTTNEAIARILYASGQIDQETFNIARGFTYDQDVENGNEDFDWSDDSNDDYIQSSFARYESMIEKMAENDLNKPAVPATEAISSKSESTAEAPTNSEPDVPPSGTNT